MFNSWQLIRKHHTSSGKKKFYSLYSLAARFVHYTALWWTSEKNSRNFLDHFSCSFLFCALIRNPQSPFYHLLSSTPPTAHIPFSCWLVGGYSSIRTGTLRLAHVWDAPGDSQVLFFLDFSLAQRPCSSLVLYMSDSTLGEMILNLSSLIWFEETLTTPPCSSWPCCLYLFMCRPLLWHLPQYVLDHHLAVIDDDLQTIEVGILSQAPALMFCACFLSRTKTHVYPLMATTAAVASSWLTLSARKPCSSIETKLPSEVREVSSLLTLHVVNPQRPRLSTEDKKKKQRVNRETSNANRHYLLWGRSCIFLWCKFSTNGLIVI